MHALSSTTRFPKKLLAAVLAAVALAAGLVALNMQKADAAIPNCYYNGTVSAWKTPQNSTRVTANKFMCSTWANAATYSTPYSTARKGTLYKGNNWVVCQRKGRTTSMTSSYGTHYNNYWLYTLGDTGGWAYVSATAFNQGRDWQPIPNVPPCIKVGV